MLRKEMSHYRPEMLADLHELIDKGFLECSTVQCPLRFVPTMNQSLVAFLACPVGFIVSVPNTVNAKRSFDRVAYLSCAATRN